MANSSQLYLLADHIKLSLLERQRAISLDLEPTSQDGHISRSLDSMREGVEALEQEEARLGNSGESNAASNIQDQAARLRSQYDDLTSQFRGFPTSSSPSTITRPNNLSLEFGFVDAQTTNHRNPSSSVLKRSHPNTPNASKSVRFRDNPTAGTYSEDDPNKVALFPYRDEPEGPPDQSELDNQQIHQFHKNVIKDQDEQLDRLGDSIGRQRDLSIQIGNELDDHVQMLDEVEEHVDRHQSTLDKARKSLGDVARKSRDKKQLTIILILIVILVLLIIILK